MIKILIAGTWILSGLCLGIALASCAAPPAGSPEATRTSPPLIPSATLPGHTPTAAAPQETPAPTATELPPPTPPVTLTIIYDNHRYLPELDVAWGFACLVERGEDSVLFDTGGDGTLLHTNLTTLGYTPQALDAVVLSHIHQDHTGGIGKLLDAGAKPSVYLPATFPANFKERIGTQVSVIEVEGPGELMPGFFTTGPIGTHIAEQALAIQTPSGLIVLTGCAHPGVVPLVQQALQVTGSKEVALLVGGFHLSGSSNTEVKEIITDLQKLGVRRVAPCHCTGAQAQRQFSEAYGPDYLTVGAGWSMLFSK